MEFKFYKQTIVTTGPNVKIHVRHEHATRVLFFFSIEPLQNIEPLVSFKLPPYCCYYEILLKPKTIVRNVRKHHFRVVLNLKHARRSLFGEHIVSCTFQISHSLEFNMMKRENVF